MSFDNCPLFFLDCCYDHFLRTHAKHFQIYEEQNACKESIHPPFKMLKATGLPAVMVCSEGECQGRKKEEFNFDAEGSKRGLFKSAPLGI